MAISDMDIVMPESMFIDIEEPVVVAIDMAVVVADPPIDMEVVIPDMSIMAGMDQQSTVEILIEILLFISNEQSFCPEDIESFGDPGRNCVIIASPTGGQI